MKKLLFTLVTVLCCTSANAQEHIRFMGLPVDGNIKNFAQQMKRIGFKRTVTSKKSGTWMFKGQFTGETCDVCVSYNKATGIVNSVMAYLPAESEKDAEVRAEKYNQMLSDKYPHAIRTINGLGRESHTEFSIPEGIISLWKSPALASRFRVAITYFDRANNTKRRIDESKDL